jgi:hypothetical protein
MQQLQQQAKSTVLNARSCSCQIDNAALAKKDKAKASTCCPVFCYSIAAAAVCSCTSMHCGLAAAVCMLRR